MDTKLSFASFTTRNRGRDRLDDDQYGSIDLITDPEDEVERLHVEIERLSARVIELEDRICSEVPKNGAVLGERISLLLQNAEETAADTVTRAEAHAGRVEEQARQSMLEAEEQARLLVTRAEDQARRVESAARAEAAEIEAEAEARAGARTRDIERWAQEVVSHTRAEEARMLAEHEKKRRALTAQIDALEIERDAAAENLRALRSALAEALTLIGREVEPAADRTGAAGDGPPKLGAGALSGDGGAEGVGGVGSRPGPSQTARSAEDDRTAGDDRWAGDGSPTEEASATAGDTERPPAASFDDEMPWPSAKPVSAVPAGRSWESATGEFPAAPDEEDGATPPVTAETGESDRPLTVRSAQAGEVAAADEANADGTGTGAPGRAAAEATADRAQGDRAGTEAMASAERERADTGPAGAVGADDDADGEFLPFGTAIAADFDARFDAWVSDSNPPHGDGGPKHFRR